MPAAPAPFEAPGALPGVIVVAFSLNLPDEVIINFAYTDTGLGAVIVDPTTIGIDANADTTNGFEGQDVVTTVAGQGNATIHWPDPFNIPGGWQLTALTGGIFVRPSLGLIGSGGGSFS